MLNFKFTQKTDPLDIAIEEAIAQLSGISIETKEYTVKVDQITKLYKLKEQNAPKRVSPDTLILAAGNILGIVLILNYEHAHVVTSKAIGFVLKAR